MSDATPQPAPAEPGHLARQAADAAWQQHYDDFATACKRLESAAAQMLLRREQQLKAAIAKEDAKSAAAKTRDHQAMVAQLDQLISQLQQLLHP